MSEAKEWLSVKRSPKGAAVVTCSLVEDNLSARWSVATTTATLRHGVADARKGAQLALSELRKAAEQ